MKLHRVLKKWRFRFFTVCLSLLLSMSIIGSFMPEVKSGSSNSKILNVAAMSLPMPATGFLWFKDKMYLTSQGDFKIYQYNGIWGSGSWSELVDTSMSTGSAIMYSDESTSIWAHAYLNNTHSRWYYTTDGTTWTYTTSQSYSGTPSYGSAWLGNGTILFNLYSDPTLIGIMRSDDWGQNWYLWKNLTALFPNTKQVISSYKAWRHGHTIAYDSNYIAVAVGDTFRSLVVSRDGGNTWQLEHRFAAPTGALALSDRVVFIGDIHEPVTIYYLSTQKYRDVRVDGWNIFYGLHPTYDSVNDVIYVGLTAANGTHGIIASPDKGESWVTVYKWQEGTREEYAYPYYHNGYVYFIIDSQNTLYRFETLPNNAVKAMSNAKLTSGLYDDVFYYNFGNASQVADIQISWTKYNMKNILRNGDIEEGNKTPGNGFPYLSATKWNSANYSYAVTNGVGVDNSKAIEFKFSDGGQEITASESWSNFADRTRLEYNEGIVIVASVKSNRTLDATFLTFSCGFQNSAGAVVWVGQTDWRDYGTISTNWRTIIGYIHTPITLSSSDYFKMYNFSIKLKGQYNQNYTNLPWTTVWIDNVALYPVPRSVMGYNGAPMQTDDHKYNFFAGLSDDNTFYRWVPTNSIMNTETPIVYANDIEITNGTTIEKAASPLKIKVKQGGLLQFKFTKVKTYAESDAAIINSSIGNYKWTLTIFVSSDQTSTTEVFVAEKGRPKNVADAASWSYDESTRILTVTAIHSGSVVITVKWQFPGDVNLDDIVNATDLLQMSEAYGSTGGPPPSLDWNLNADLNGDNVVNASDLVIVGKNFGKIPD